MLATTALIVGSCDFVSADAVPDKPAAFDAIQSRSDGVSQKNIAPSQDRMWSILRRTRIELDFKRGVYTATHPSEVKALVGTAITIEGFVVPVKAEIEFRHFLLMPYAPTCPFCPPPDFNEVVEVNASEPIRSEERLFTVTGTFAIQDNGKEGLFFRLDDARAR